MKKLIIVVGLCVLPILAFSQTVDVDADTITPPDPEAIAPKLPPEPITWRNYDFQNSIGLMGGLSLGGSSKDNSAFVGLIHNWQFYKADEKPFVASISTEYQLFKSQANTNSNDSYVNLDGSIINNKESYLARGINVSPMVEGAYSGGLPLFLSIAIGPSFSLADMKRSKEVRYYNGSDLPSVKEFKMSDTQFGLGYAARLKVGVLMHNKILFFGFAGSQRYFSQLSTPLLFGFGLQTRINHQSWQKSQE
jgi:hypothetical protein